METPVKWLGLSLLTILLCGCGGGSSSAPPPAGLSYITQAAVYTVGTTIPANSPTGTRGAATAYVASPNLPAGLSLDDDTGIISGTPTAVTATASYTITASNVTGSTTATLTITVNAAAAGVQFIPNMNQWITPLAPQGSQFQSLTTPWLVNGNPWLAGQAVSSVVRREHPVGSDQRVQSHFLRGTPQAWPSRPEPPAGRLRVRRPRRPRGPGGQLALE